MDKVKIHHMPASAEAQTPEPQRLPQPSPLNIAIAVVDVEFRAGYPDTILRQYTYGNYLDEVWTIDNRAGGITVASLNNGSGSQRHFYHCNSLYHVYGLTEEAGALKEAYQYDAYGKQTVITDGNDGDTIVNFGANDVRTVGGNSTLNNPYMYTGQRFDPETGLMYYKNRYYSADQGRFISRDPIGYIAGPNLYQFVVSAPSKFMDPFGLLTPTEEGRSLATSKEFCCECLETAKKAKAWDEKMKGEYERAKNDTANTTGGDIEAAVEASLTRQGIRTTTAGTTSATGQVTVHKQKGPCAKLKEKDTEVHEGVHQKHQQDLERQHGRGTTAFNNAWDNAQDWAQDEMNAYTAGAEVNEGFIDWCKKVYWVEDPKKWPCTPLPCAGVPDQKKLGEGRTPEVPLPRDPGGWNWPRIPVPNFPGLPRLPRLPGLPSL